MKTMRTSDVMAAAAEITPTEPTADRNPRLSFVDVSHDYDGMPSVRGVSLDVAPGEVLCLLGQSGSGKTTLLRIAAGIERQKSGQVVVDGAVVAGSGTFLPPERRGIGLMFQDYALFPHLTILQNVLFGLSGQSRPVAEETARRALMAVGLEDYAADYPHALSGGEQQRVALARAMAPSPSVILMDEPFSGLDRRLREDVRDKTLSVIAQTKATCIVVTHDPEEAMRMGDRIALLRNGRIVQLGTPEDLFRRPAELFVARFFSDLNEMPGIVGDGAVQTPLGTFAAKHLDDGTGVVVGIRPNDIELSGAGHDGLAGSMSGRVVRRRFLGEVDLFDVEVEGLDELVSVRVRGANFQAGDPVSLRIEPEAPFVFRAD